MSKFFLIAPSRDSKAFDEAGILAQAGHQVTLYAVQNGVFSLLNGRQQALVSHNIFILADDYSLMERGISADLPGVTVVDMNKMMSVMLKDEQKVIWY